MLDPINPWGRPVRPSLGAEIVAHVANEPWQVLGYRELRRAIFAEEQGLFEGSDFDEHDTHALPIVAESQIAGMADQVVGVVRIFRSEPGTWYGGRLGVRREFRRFGAIGSALIATRVSVPRTRTAVSASWPPCSSPTSATSSGITSASCVRCRCSGDPTS